MNQKHTILLVPVLLLSGCSWFSPIGRALDKLDAARSMTVQITCESSTDELFNALIEIEGNLIHTTIGDYEDYLVIDYRAEKVEVYTKDWNDNWSSYEASFEDFEFDSETDSYSFNIDQNWLVASETNDQEFNVLSDYKDEFNPLLEVLETIIESNYSTDEVIIKMTENEIIESITMSIWGDDIYELRYLFSEYNNTDIELPVLVGID